MLTLRPKRLSACFILCKDGRRTDVVVQKLGSSPDSWAAYRPFDDSHNFIARASSEEELIKNLEELGV